MNIFVLDRNYNKIGVLSNQGANPTAPYFDDLYVQELDTGADTFTFSTLSTYYTQDIIEIGHHVIFEYNNEHKLFAISSIEFSHKDGFNLIEVYAEGVGFNLLDNYIENLEGSYNYESFLAKVLAGTDWRYAVSGSLANNVQEISYTSEKNIYAVLQDSMQTFLGAELKFVAEYRNGSLTKTIYAYGNGERGSFVGKRFEYGVNVKGITKTLNIANEKDENVIFNEGLVIIDGVEVEISYDVDFALRSFEVEELDIGDTHYVIDNDFDPPLQIKARIGKIEISFSDPTKNKCYLANFKKVTGSKSEDPDGQDVEDMIDDKLEDIGNGFDDRFNDIEERLDKLENPEEEEPTDPEPEGPVNIGFNDNLIKAPRMHSYEFLLYTNKDGSPNFTPSSRTTDYSVIDNPTNEEGEHPTSEDIYNFLINEVSVFDVSYRVLDYLEHVAQGTGVTASNYCLRITPDTLNFCTDHSTTDYMDECSMSLAGSRIFSDIIDPSTDRPDFEDGLTLLDDPNVSNISRDHHDKHMLDIGSLSCALVSAMQYHVKKGDHLSEEAIEEALTDYTTKDYVDTAVAGMSIDLSDYATKDYVEDTLNQIGLTDYATKNYVSTYYTTTEHLQTYYATKTYVDDAIEGIEIPELSGYATEEYVDSAIEAIEIPDVSVYATKQSLSDFNSYVNLTYATHAQMNGAIETSETDMKAYIDETIETSETDMKAYVDEAIEGIESDSGGLPSDVFEVIDGNLHIKLPINFEDSANFVNCTIGEGPSKASLTGAEGIEAMTIYCANINPVYDGSGIVRIDGDLEVTGNITSAGSSGSDGSILNGMIKYIEEEYSSMYLGETYVEVFDDMYVNGSLLVTGSIVGVDALEGVEFLDVDDISVSGDIESSGNITTTGNITCNSLAQTSDRSLKENIRYIDDSVMTISSDDLLEKADLYDFIVNQIDLCEFNFIGDDSDKIGFIANDYEGTKVGDKIISKYGETLTYDVSNLLFATIGALQEEVRIRDEKIASLEDRLAKIEAMLGIDNN